MIIPRIKDIIRAILGRPRFADRFKIFSEILEEYGVEFYHKDSLGIMTRRLPSDNFQYIFSNNSSCDAVPMMLCISRKVGHVRTSFDVGANIGITAAWLSSISDLVYAFEPIEENLARMKDTLNVNGCENVVVIPKAVSNQVTEGTINITKSYGHHTLEARHLSDFIGSRRIMLETLDHFCETHGVEEIDILKIDTEGHEAKVLAGCGRLLELKKIRMIIFEYQRSMDQLNETKNLSVFGLLFDHGYSVFDISDRKIDPESLERYLSEQENYDFYAIFE